MTGRSGTRGPWITSGRCCSPGSPPARRRSLGGATVPAGPAIPAAHRNAVAPARPAGRARPMPRRSPAGCVAAFRCLAAAVAALPAAAGTVAWQTDPILAGRGPGVPGALSQDDIAQMRGERDIETVVEEERVTRGTTGVCRAADARGHGAGHPAARGRQVARIPAVRRARNRPRVRPWSGLVRGDG